MSLMIENGYLCKDSNLSEAGPKHGRCKRNEFVYEYWRLHHRHQPHRLHEDNHALDIDDYPDDYYFTDDLTDQAIK